MSKFGKRYSSLASLVVVILFIILIFVRNLPSEARDAFNKAYREIAILFLPEQGEQIGMR